MFRGTLPYMAALLTFHPLLRQAWNAVKPINSKKPIGAAHMEQRVSFDYAFAFVFLFALHGVSAFKVFGILYINYQLATKLPRPYVPAATWAFNICTLFANEIFAGYPLRKAAALLSPPELVGADLHTVDSALMEWGRWLDSFGGVVARWEVLFNITVLRLISFNLDYYWSRDKNQAGIFEVRGPANYPFLEQPLIHPRRSNSTRRAYLKRTESRSPPTSTTTLSVTTWPMPFMRRSTSQAQ